MRILPGIFSKRQTDFDFLAAQESSYCCFWWVDAAIRDGTVKIVGRAVIPKDHRKMPLFKWGIRNLKTTRISRWNVWDGRTRSSRPVRRLTKEQRQYPLKEIVPIDVVVERIEQGWTPADEC